MQGTFFVKIFNKLWFGGVSVGHLNLANAKLSSQKQKSLLNFFKNCGFGQRPYNLPILQSFRRKQPRCLRAKTKFVKTGGSLLEKNLLIYCLMKGFLVAIAFKGLSPLRSNRQTASCLAIVDCISGKYLWALPTPTTFEKVDQTFIIDWQINLLNHNISRLSQKLNL